MMKNNVVITAVSAITPLGNDLNIIQNCLKSGQSGIRHITRYDMSGFPVRHGGECDLSLLESFKYPFSGNIQFKLFFYTISNLINQMNGEYLPRQTGIFVGLDPNLACINDFNHLYKCYDLLNNEQRLFDWNNLNQKEIFNADPSLLFYYAAKMFNINGPCIGNLGTCSASTQSIGTAYTMIKNGQIQKAIAGGVSSKVDPISITRLSRLDALETTKDDISENCRPFDKNRNGFTISEGAVLFALESEESAKKRNAKIFAEIKGYGSALDGFSITAPHEEALGMTLSMNRALNDAGIDSRSIDYLNAHGTATLKNDLFETMAIKNVFAQNDVLSISSTKSMHGHLMTAAGAMEALVCILAMSENYIPPTINYRTPDPLCDLDYTPNVMKKKNINCCMSNSFGLGGQNATLIFSKYEKERTW